MKYEIELLFGKSGRMPIMREYGGIRFEVGAQCSPIAIADINSAEAALRCRFPLEYRNFVVEFGAGEFSPVPLRVPAPSEIARNAGDDQCRFREHWFWEASADIFSQEMACESISCFDGSSGDDVIFHPSQPDVIYILPHDSEAIFRVDTFGELVSRFAALHKTTTDGLGFRPEQTGA